MSRERFQIGEVVELPPDRPFRRVLVEEGDFRVAVMGLKEGVEIPEHQTPGDAALVVWSGKVLLFTEDGTAPEELGRGAIVHLPLGTRHSLRAVRDAVLLVSARLAGEATELAASTGEERG